jgi:hypothetical protein
MVPEFETLDGRIIFTSPKAIGTMKLLVLIIGIIILILGLVLYSSPLALSTLSNDSGVSGTVVTTTKILYLSVNPGNYTSQKISLNHNNNLIVSYESDPSGVDFLLMNQGNYTLFVSGVQSNVQVYNESELTRGNFSFSFNTNSANNQNYYLVFKALPGRNVTTGIKFNFEITDQVSDFNVLYIPYSILALGLMLILAGAFAGTRKKSVLPPAPTAQKGGTPGGTFSSNEVKCKFCGASMPSTQLFCPSCGKSQT